MKRASKLGISKKKRKHESAAKTEKGRGLQGKEQKRESMMFGKDSWERESSSDFQRDAAPD